MSRAKLTVIAGVCALAWSGCKARNGSKTLDEAVGGGGAVDHSGDPLWDQYVKDFNYDDQIKGLDADAQVGRKVWYFATAGNARHHSYVLPQLLGLVPDYYDVFKADRRGKDRFSHWGIIPDPSCLTPAEFEQKYGATAWPDPENKSYGFDVCPGDMGPRGLLAAVANPSAMTDDNVWTNDSACTQGVGEAGDCHLHFGTSAGGMGFRKFPNPRFNKNKWKRINGWQGYSKDGGQLTDASIQPPFLIGHACGSCHISYNPEHPPANPEAPEWANIKGAVGAQYLHISEILASGMPDTALEWQLFTHARPGTSDTSAVTMDNVNNPGTMNAIMNINNRPGIVNTQLPGATQDPAITALTPPTHTFRYYGVNGEAGWAEHHAEVVPQILKGGEDTVGVHGAVQRVYLNIGLCSEACLANNLEDIRTLFGRKSRETPVRVDQCFRDCPEFVAVAKKTTNVFKFLVAQPSFELYKAKGKASRAELITDLGKDKVDLGMKIFASQCSRCHSSRVDPNASAQERMDILTDPTSDRYALQEDESGRLKDWFGNDRRTSITEVGTYRCRALHSNHMQGHLFEMYGSKEMRATPAPAGVAELAGSQSPDGRGYMRNISLLSLWAFAPFLHNNSVGPELCADFPLALLKNPNGAQEGCLKADPSVDGRLALFQASIQSLFNVTPRGDKVIVTNKPIIFPLGPDVNLHLPSLTNNSAMFVPGAMKLVLPAGLPITLVGSIDQKAMAQKIFNDLSQSLSGVDYTQVPAALTQFGQKIESIYNSDTVTLANYLRKQTYVNCGLDQNDAGTDGVGDIAEDKGHMFITYSADKAANAEHPEQVDGGVLNKDQLDALVAFLQTI